MGVRLDGVTASSRRAIRLAARDGDECMYCFLVLDDATRTIEHVVPRSQGGGSGMGNLRLACRACNVMRSDGPHLLFVVWRRKYPDGDGKAWRSHLAAHAPVVGPPAPRDHRPTRPAKQPKRPARSSQPIGPIPAGTCAACHADAKLTVGKDLSEGEWRRWAGGCTCGARPRCAACEMYRRSEILAGVPWRERKQRSPHGCTCDQENPVLWAEMVPSRSTSGG